MIRTFKRVTVFSILLVIVLANIVLAQGAYYTGIDPNSSSFVNDLKTRIRDPYTRVSYDQFDETNIANYASYLKSGSTRGVRCVYSNYEYQYTGTFLWDVFSREHTFCFSWMPSYPSENVDQYSDQHHLFPAHQNGANGPRSNHPLGVVTTVISSFWDGKYGRNSENQLVYEPRDAHKGDAARALLYMMLRYDDLNGYQWDFNWLNGTRLPSLGEASQNLALLLQWHTADPPDSWEKGRNDYIETIQQNRNPFIDHPEYTNNINFNDMTYISTSSSSNTVVNFVPTAGSVNEGGVSYNLTLSITNPSPTAACSVDVALTGGTAGDLGNYTTQKVIFPANSSANQTVTVNITDDALEEDDEVFTFSLQNITGGTVAAAGINDAFFLTIVDNDRSLFISEYSDATDFIYEFVEIYNDKNYAVDMSGYKLQQYNASHTYTIPSGTIIPSKGFVIVGRNSTQAAFETNWGIVLDALNVVYLNSGGSAVPQINGDEVFLLQNNLSTAVDPSSGASTLTPITANNRVYRVGRGNTVSDWVLTSNSTATPGTSDDASALPVELKSFSGKLVGNSVVLEWATATEVNCYGFEVEKREWMNGCMNEWKEIGFVAGSGNSNSIKEYSFADDFNHSVIQAPVPSWAGFNHSFRYRLKQIDNDGTFAYSKEIEVESLRPSTFDLRQNYPNPFNPSTGISYQLPVKSFVSLKLYDITGVEIATLVNEEKEAGVYNYELGINNYALTSGVYFYQLRAGEFVSTKKLMIIK